MRIIDRVDELLKANNLTSKQLANGIGVSPGNVTEWRKNRATPSADTIIKLAEYFNVSTDYLLDRSNVRRPREIAAASSEVSYNELPPEAIKELEQYKEFLKQKYGRKKE